MSRLLESGTQQHFPILQNFGNHDFAVVPYISSVPVHIWSIIKHRSRWRVRFIFNLFLAQRVCPEHNTLETISQRIHGLIAQYTNRRIWICRLDRSIFPKYGMPIAEQQHPEWNILVSGEFSYCLKRIIIMVFYHISLGVLVLSVIMIYYGIDIYRPYPPCISIEDALNNIGNWLTF